MQVAIIYDSGYGHTTQQALAVAEGVHQVEGINVKLIAIADGAIPWDELEASDAIIFGSPTYNGTVSARFKQFIEDSTKTVWRELKWRNKFAAGFTHSGAPSGDKLNTLMSLSLFAAQHGMIWVNLDLLPGSANVGVGSKLNRLGGWLGAMAQSNSTEGEDAEAIASDMATASYLGQHVAQIAKQFHHQ